MILTKLFRRLRRRFCRHRTDPHDIVRLSSDLVAAPCLKCGKILFAPYGLALPNDFTASQPAKKSEP